MDNKECVAILSTDMGKAFEELHHALMIKKLETYGFSDISLELMRSYFIERKNRVKIKNIRERSVKELPAKFWPLGPLLWILTMTYLWTYTPVTCSRMLMIIIDKNRYRKSIDIIGINRFNPPTKINWHRKSIEIEVTEKKLSIIID